MVLKGRVNKTRNQTRSPKNWTKSPKKCMRTIQQPSPRQKASTDLKQKASSVKGKNKQLEKSFDVIGKSDRITHCCGFFNQCWIFCPVEAIQMDTFYESL